VLDTTGSMSGLIEGAKAKIWSIANQMIAANPRPRLRVSLIAYRDRVTRTSPGSTIFRTTWTPSTRTCRISGRTEEGIRRSP